MSRAPKARLLLVGAILLTTTALASTSSDSPITVTERLALDQRIRADVINVLARSADLSGRVSVEARDQVVNLSGYLATQGQVRRAGLEAGRVQGVKFVVNEIRPRLGPATN